MPTWVALLRCVNVGGKNRLPMRDLVEIFGDAGCAAPTSYIQSGNDHGAELEDGPRAARDDGTPLRHPGRRVTLRLPSPCAFP